MLAGLLPFRFSRGAGFLSTPAARGATTKDPNPRLKARRPALRLIHGAR